MSKLKVKVDVFRAQKLRTLVGLLSKSIEDLPSKLQSEVRDILNSSVFEYDADWYNKKFGHIKPTVIVDGVNSDLLITSWNPHLKLVKYQCRDDNENPIVKDGTFIFGEISPNSFELYAGDVLVVRW